MNPTMPKTRLLLLGGGWTHICLLNRLTRFESSQLKMILVTPYPYLYYPEMAAGYLTENFQETEIVVDITDLCYRRGIHYIQATPIQLDISGKTVVLEDGRSISYDILSLDLDCLGRQIEGVDKYGFPVLYQDNLQKIKKHFGSYDIDTNLTIIGAGKLGIEIALALRQLMNEHPCPGGRDNRPTITLIEANQSLLPGHDLKVKKIIQDELKRRRIELLLGRKVIRVTGDFLVFNDNSLLDYGYLIWTPKPVDKPILMNSGLAIDENKRLIINRGMQVIDKLFIFACGSSVRLPGEYISCFCSDPEAVARCLLTNIVRMRKGKPLYEFSISKKDPGVLILGNKRTLPLKPKLFFQSQLGWYSRISQDEKFIQKLQGFHSG